MVFGYNLDRSRQIAIHKKWTTALLCFKTCFHLLLIDFLSIWRNSQICSQLTLVRVISTWETNVPRCILPGTLNVKVTDPNFWNTFFLQFLFSFIFCITLSALNNVKTTLSSFAITLGKYPKELKVRVRIPAAVNHFTSNQQFSAVTAWQMELKLAFQRERHLFFYSQFFKSRNRIDSIDEGSVCNRAWCLVVVFCFNKPCLYVPALQFFQSRFCSKRALRQKK